MRKIERALRHAFRPWRISIQYGDEFEPAYFGYLILVWLTQDGAPIRIKVSYAQVDELPDEQLARELVRLGLR